MSDHKPGRRDREYPHGSGDRNAWAPTGKRRQPVHRGGSERAADPDVGGPDEDDTGEGPPERPSRNESKP